MKFPWMKQEDAVGFYDFTVGGTEPHPNHKKTNYIRTTKTTLLTFLPISLFGQVFFLFKKKSQKSQKSY